MITIKVRFNYDWGPVVATVDEKGVWTVDESYYLSDLIEMYLNSLYGPNLY